MKMLQIGAVTVALSLLVAGCSTSPTEATRGSAEVHPRFDGGGITGSGNRAAPTDADSTATGKSVASSFVVPTLK